MIEPLDDSVDNPYRSPNAASGNPTTRPRTWLIAAGAALLILAAVCVLATVVGMMFAFNALANSPTVKPSDLADNLRVALAPSIAAVPLVILGAVLLAIGRASASKRSIERDDGSTP